MATRKYKIQKTEKGLQTFVREVTETLLEGKRHQTPGPETFSTCTRKATADRVTCKMAIFRASQELRQFANGGHSPSVSGSHAEIVRVIVEAMQSEQGIDVPLLGHLAVIPILGKNPKLIFHGAQELNDALATS
ncbi:MAG: hypothetical protein ACI9XC_001766 [Gammaproteobacteria bacterium]|jgi:hypothetical protein